MRRFLLFCALATISISCKNAETPIPPNQIPGWGEEKPIFLNSCILGYYAGDITCSRDRSQMRLVIENQKFYPNPDYTLYPKYDDFVDEDFETYRLLAERNGDTSYDREDYPYLCTIRFCYAENFKEVHVVCTNQYLDAAHPAGSLLDDIVIFKALSFANYIHHGYVDDGYNFDDAEIVPYKYLDCRVSELSAEDLSMLGTFNEPYFVFPENTLQRNVTYELKVTLVTTEGVEKTATGSICLK